MKICLVGLNHRTAPVEVREKVAIATDEVLKALEIIRELKGVLDCCLIATCNRFEVLFLLNEEIDPGSTFGEFINKWRGLDLDFTRPHTYIYSERNAILHLFRVTSSLDSMIVGEPQIVGQVRQAVQIARSHGFLNTQLAGLFERAAFVAKRVRKETEIASSAVSVSYAAVELARKIFEDLKDKKVVLLGAGKMSELTARHLMNCGIRGVVVSTRTYQRAVELAGRLRGQAARFDEIRPHLQSADIIIASTSAPHYILTREQVAEAVRGRRNRPLFLIDIAVPRNIDPSVNDLPDVFVYNIDDLKEVVGMNLKMRRKAADQAEKIVRQEVEGYLRSLEMQSCGPQIETLRSTLEKICREELAKARNRMESVSENDEKIMELMIHRIVNKISHPLIMEIKKSPRHAQWLGHRILTVFQMCRGNS